MLGVVGGVQVGWRRGLRPGYDPASSVRWVAGLAALLLYQVHHLVHCHPKYTSSTKDPASHTTILEPTVSQYSTSILAHHNQFCTNGGCPCKGILFKWYSISDLKLLLGKAWNEGML